ncbi:TetR/AcrR family transcriptional regulator [Chelativorans sp. Marseille-P2723]|uniref:TetR/AcrR family transcriptional regulator n=1 Tax=Chelativorans sp. Marseille-P2723 TaxID=2709133 RepID=UPI00156F38B9|nr:TetR/AcrR family transcriptional regulator [Chelativorans sp. Marseille-P2723]
MTTLEEPRPASKSNLTKERILQVAAELFARNGYDATGIAELCNAVDLGRGALYHHIESKESLLFEISMRHMSAMADRSEELIALDLPPDEKLRQLSRLLLRMIADSRPEATVTFRDARALSTDRASALGKQRRRVEAAWQRLLDDGMREGKFRPIAPVVMKGLWGMHVIAYRWIEPDGDLSPEQIADVFCDVLLRGVLTSDSQS